MRGRLAAVAAVAAALAAPAGAQLAPLRAESATTRALALTLERDHTLALAQLQTIAAALGWRIALTPSRAQQKVLAELRAYDQGGGTRNGKSFDEAFDA